MTAAWYFTDQDRLAIADAFDKIADYAFSLAEILGRREDLNDSVPVNWPLGMSCDEFALACCAMREFYKETAYTDAFKIGDRVRLTQDVDHYPVGIFAAGETGTITGFEPDKVWVCLDCYHAELAEWNNKLEVVDWSVINNSADDPSLLDLLEKIAPVEVDSWESNTLDAG